MKFSAPASSKTTKKSPSKAVSQRKRVARAKSSSPVLPDPEEEARRIAQIRSRARAKVAPPSASPSSYRHSAYYYAYHYGRTYSEATSYTERYLDFHTFYPHGDRSRTKQFDSTFNPLMLGACIMMDIGVAVKNEVEQVTDPRKRAAMMAEMRRNLRILRRPFYYARETERRRALARERRKLHRRTTTAPMPTPEALLEAWTRRKDSKEAMILLGGMVHDLECYVDNSLKFDVNGDVVGRNHGIRGWLKENLPELSDKYKTLMRYKAMAKRLRQATGTKDPKPTSVLLEEPQGEVVQAVLRNFRTTFSSLEESIAEFIDPEMVFREQKAVGREKKAVGREKRTVARKQETVVRKQKTVDREQETAATEPKPTLRKSNNGA